jgi:hypothetical protein
MAPLDSVSDVRVRVFTVSLREVIDIKYEDVAPAGYVLIPPVANDGSALANGIYYIEITAGKNRWTMHLLILR